jgi:hypothetical protein
MSSFDWSPNGESYDFAIDEYARRLSSIVQKELLSFDISIDKFEANRLAKKWLFELEAKRPEEVLNLISSNSSIEDLSAAIVETILLNIAEERPGTNPWQHEAIIPMPLHLIFTQISTLSLASAVALSNTDPEWVSNSQANIIAASNYVSSKIARGEIAEDTVEVLVNGEVRLYTGQVVYLPQSAVAYLARFFENVTLRIVEQGWVVSNDMMSWTDTIASLKIQSDLLRHLNKTYGRNSSPGPAS